MQTQEKDSCQSDFSRPKKPDFLKKNGYECCFILSIFYCNAFTENSAYLICLIFSSLAVNLDGTASVMLNYLAVALF